MLLSCKENIICSWSTERGGKTNVWENIINHIRRVHHVYNRLTEVRTQRNLNIHFFTSFLVIVHKVYRHLIQSRVFKPPLDKIMNSALGCNYTGILLSASELLHFNPDISSSFLNLPYKDQEGFLIISLQRILRFFKRTSSFLCSWSFSTHGSGSVKLHIFVDPEPWSLMIQITGTLIRILNLIPTVQYCT